MKKTIKTLSTILVILLAFSAIGCSNTAKTTDGKPSTSEEANTEENTAGTEPITVKIGVVGENNEQWTPVKEALAKENIVIELVKFSDYSLPNQALADGEIDLNAFQHYAFLDNEIENRGLELSVIGESIIAPLGVYSTKIEDIKELKKGDKIAIPNDATNGGRSLKVLEAAGLITVNPDVGYLPILNDITANPLSIEFIEVEAAQTPSLLPDVAAAIINGGHAVDASYIPSDDAIYLEAVVEGSDNPYINVIVARTIDKDNETYAKVVSTFQTDEVSEVIGTTYKGAYLPAWK